MASLALALVCLLALGVSAASYAMGLILKDEDAFAPFIQGVSLPLLLLSGVLLPMTLAPAWLRNASPPGAPGPSSGRAPDAPGRGRCRPAGQGGS